MAPPRARPATVGLLAATLAALGTGMTGCADTGTHGDCAARVRYHDTMYEPRYDVRLRASTASTPLGSADIVDCGSLATARTVDTRQLVAIDNVDPDIAVLIPHGKWHALYIADGLPRASWPVALSEAIATSTAHPAHR